jgi:SAM-dependent methyltransferase
MAYADYILSTGGALAQLEEAKGRHIYQSYFRGRSPILDIGPGRCWFTRQDPQSIVALDNEPALVHHFGAQGLNTALGSVYEIPFESKSFDGVFCCWLFEHLDDPARAIHEIGRVLRDGGFLFMVVPSPRTLLTTFYDDFTHVRPFTKVSLLELAREGGLSRAQADFLYWTRGTGKLSRLAGPNVTQNVLSFLDRFGRRIGLVNRDHLVLQAWK